MKNMSDHTPLPRNVRLLIGMRAARSLGQGAMVAAFTLYLHALGWSGTAIGAVLMGALLVGSALTIAVGPLSDRGGRRLFLIGYDCLQVVAAITAMLTTTPWLLVTAAIIGGFGRGANGSAGPFAPIEQAWFAIELPIHRRGGVFSRNSAIGFIGMAVGAALAAVPALVMGHQMGLDGYRALFVLPLAGSLVSLALLGLAREPVIPPRADDTVEAGTRERHQENRLLRRLVMVNLLNGTAIGLIGPLTAFWFAIKFHHGLDTIGPGLAIGFVLGAVGSWLAAKMAKRYNVIRTIIGMRGTGILLLIAMPLAPWFWLAMVLYMLRGACNRGTAGVRQALAAGLTRVERRGLASSLQNISIQLPRAIGPVIGGALFHAGYLNLPFYISAVLQLAYLALYVRFFGKLPAAQARG
ncbi:MAG TPA: MFS transporter [Rhodanobacteraceae bacterium]|nr:MFS transporter [Rhodanobacteraceae bacterium]